MNTRGSSLHLQLGKNAPLLIGILGILVWLVAVLNTNIEDVPLSTTFGLMQLMPWYFWAGVILLALSDGLVLKYGTSRQRFSLLVMTALVFLATPCFVEPFGRQHDAYWHAALVKGVLQRGFGSSQLAGHSYVDNWPTSYVLDAIILLITGGSAIGLIRWYPIFVSFTLLLGFYVFSRKILRNDQIVFLACIFMIFGETYLELHLSPAAIGTALAPLFLWLFLSEKPVFSVLSIVLFSVIVSMHPITPILLIATVLILFLSTKIFYRNRIGQMERMTLHPIRIVFLCVVFAAWQIYIGTYGVSIFANVFNDFYKTIFSASRVQGTFSAFQTTLPYKPEVSFLRRGLFVFYGGLGLAGSYYAYRRKSNVMIRGLSLFSLICVFILSSFAISYIYQSVTYFARPIDYMIFFSSMSVALLLFKPSGKRVIVITSLICLLAFPCIIAPYVEESQLMVRKSEVAVMAFAPAYIPRQTRLCAEIPSDFLFFDDQWNYTLVNYNSSTTPFMYTLFNLQEADTIIFVASALPRYVNLMGFDMGTEAYQNATTFVTTTPGYNKVYDNGPNIIYIHEQNKPLN